MNVFMTAFCVVASSYLVAAVPWGVVIGRINGIDIRSHGSGNIGATNVRRVLGKFWGGVCFLLDFIKGFLPVLAVKSAGNAGWIDDPHQLYVIAAAAACVSGHVWSVFIGFKGGKGVSTSAGILLAVAPLALLVAGAVWLAVFYLFRYVSLASICAATTLPIVAVAFTVAGVQPLAWPLLTLLALLAALTAARHRDNIRRLMAGTENRFKREKSKDTA